MRIEPDIELFFEETFFTNGDIAAVDIYYIAKENTAHVEQYGYVPYIHNKYLIPDRIPKTKEGILRYLKEEVKDELAIRFGHIEEGVAVDRRNNDSCFSPGTHSDEKEMKMSEFKPDQLGVALVYASPEVMRGEIGAVYASPRSYPTLIPVHEENGQRYCTEPKDGCFIFRPRVFLTINSGNIRGTVYEIGCDKMLLGRLPECRIRFPESYISVSRKHCSIQFDTNCNLFHIEDYSSQGIYDKAGNRMNKEAYVLPGTVLYLANQDCEIILTLDTPAYPFGRDGEDSINTIYDSPSVW